MTKETGRLTGPDGQQYQMGAVYEFSDNGRTWFARNISEIYRDGLSFVKHNIGWRYIRECQAPIGKIKEPEIVPEKECWYLCETKEGFRDVYYYDDGFFCFRGNSYIEEELKIIRKADV